MELIDLRGKRFGQLVVIKRSESVKNRTKWLCRCDCGNEKIVDQGNLASGLTKTCGARIHRIKDLTGNRFGRLTVISLANAKGAARWLCQCDCGEQTTVIGASLLNGSTKSCGCEQKEIAAQTGSKTATHGESKSPLYSVWCGIIRRTENPNCDHYKWYGGRGIKMCDEWRHDYTAFRNWAKANGYKKGLSIDRIDNQKNYSPDNCRWITISENVKKSFKERGYGTEIPSNA